MTDEIERREIVKHLLTGGTEQETGIRDEFFEDND